MLAMLERLLAHEISRAPMGPRRGRLQEPVLAVAQPHARPGLVQHELSVIGAIVVAVQLGGRIGDLWPGSPDPVTMLSASDDLRCVSLRLPNSWDVRSSERPIRALSSQSPDWSLKRVPWNLLYQCRPGRSEEPKGEPSQRSQGDQDQSGCAQPRRQEAEAASQDQSENASQP